MQYRKFDLEEYRRQMKSFIGDGPETNVFWDALDFAFEAHGDQWRRSGDPYIMHPCSVARILAEELDVLERVKGRGHQDRLRCINGLACLRMKQKRYEDA